MAGTDPVVTCAALHQYASGIEIVAGRSKRPRGWTALWSFGKRSPEGTAPLPRWPATGAHEGSQAVPGSVARAAGERQPGVAIAPFRRRSANAVSDSLR